MMLCCLFLAGLVAYSRAADIQDTLGALANGLQYMDDNLSTINLDGVFGVRIVSDQLTALLENEPFVVQSYHDLVSQLRDQANDIANIGMKQVNRNDPIYSNSLGRLLGHSKKHLWYPSRSTDSNTVVKPLPCAMYDPNRTYHRNVSVFNEAASDRCLEGIMGKKSEAVNPCRITPECVELMTAPRQQAYAITHQVLYWQLLEMHGCIQDVPEILRVTLCSNILRDSIQIARLKFPIDQEDIFMEQIGLCGMWGFEDFYRQDWLDNILKWQQPSGCFTSDRLWSCINHVKLNSHIRVKRKEKLLKDGCLSHKTTVALMAIAESLRFQAEELFYKKVESTF